jgi:hypothetical protein
MDEPPDRVWTFVSLFDSSCACTRTEQHRDQRQQTDWQTGAFCGPARPAFLHNAMM